MRITIARSITLGVSLLAAACGVDSAPGSRASIQREALGAAPSNPSVDAIGGRYIVKFRDQAAGKAALKATGARVVLDLLPQNAAAAHIPAQALDALRLNPAIDYIEEDPIRKPLAQTTPYGITMVQADLVNDPAEATRTVCIIDSGYYLGHEDLGTTNVTGTNVSGTGNWYQDTCGHGSHVAGTIAAVNNNVGVVGVTGNVKLHIVKVFDGEACNWAYASSLVSALNTCTGAGANVINMSLGGGSSSITEKNAFQSAYDSGVLSIAAAGNSGTSSNTNDPASYPASYASVVSVAAVDATQAHAAFSQENSSVEIAAPGVAVESTIPWVETNSLTAGGTTWAGTLVEGAARTTAAGVSAVLADGGLCDATNAAWSGKVVLCQRGSVSFAAKVDNVTQSAGVAAVIYNNVAGELYATLGAGVTGTIPAIALSDTQGAAALAHVGTTGTVVSHHATPASGYEAWDGTSMATPHVVGVAALVWSHFPSCTNAEVRNALTSTALDLGAAGRDSSYGYGLVQALAAYDSLAAGCGGAGGGGGDTVAPVISNVTGTVTNAKRGAFKITWTTDEASTSTVTFANGGTYNNTTLVTSHSMSFRGTRGTTYIYSVSSKDAAGNSGSSGTYSITIP